MNEYTSPTQFIDLVTQQKTIRKEIDAAIKQVLDHGQYIMGPEVREFEKKLSEFTGSKYSFTCANGTDALTIVLMAWGIGPGDAVFVPSFTYVATAEAPAQLGATPFFVDVCKDSFNIDIDSLKQALIECRELGLNPAAIIPVDLFGQPANIDKVEEIAKSEKLKVLIDGAQSFGASSNKRVVGSMGDATTTSFFPAKPLGCYGDGGAIFTQDDKLAEIIASIRLHGKGTEKYDNIRIGMNSRLDTIQAAILIEKLKIFPKELIRRNELANFYRNKLNTRYSVPVLSSDNTSSWAQYTIVSSQREKILSHLKKFSIPSAIYYPKALSEQLGYKHYPSVASGTPISHYLSSRVFSLPMHPYMKTEQANQIVNVLNDFKK